MNTFQILLAASLALIALPALAQVQITDAYGRSTGASGAVFLTITNPDVTDDRLLSATTDAAEMAMLHTSMMDANGVMSMPELAGGVVIPAGGAHALARGGDHIMLMGLTAPLKDGDTLRLILTFELAGPIALDVVIDNKRQK